MTMQAHPGFIARAGKFQGVVVLCDDNTTIGQFESPLPYDTIDEALEDADEMSWQVLYQWASRKKV